MTEFKPKLNGAKVGDRVIVVDAWPTNHNGEEGVLLPTDNPHRACVALDDGGRWYCREVRPVDRPRRVVHQSWGPCTVLGEHEDRLWLLTDQGAYATGLAESCRDLDASPTPDDGHKHWAGCYHKDA